MRRDGFFPPGLLVHRLSQGQIRAVSVSTQFCRSRNGSRRGKARRAYACMAKGFDEAWAHFCPSKPCLPLSIDVSMWLDRAEHILVRRLNPKAKEKPQNSRGFPKPICRQSLLVIISISYRVSIVSQKSGRKFPV